MFFFNKSYKEADYTCLNCHSFTKFQYTEQEAICPKCHSSYPLLHKHIPVFLDEVLGNANHYGEMFKERAAQYTEDYRLDDEHSRWVLQRLKALEPKIQQYENKVWLEIGAGNGLLTQHLINQQFLTYKKLYVSDLSSEMLSVNWQKHASMQTQHVAKFAVFNVLKTPFPNEHIDLVIGFEILHHILNYPLALKELARITKPGGVCLFKEPLRDALNFYCFIIQLVLRLGNLPENEQQLISHWRAHFSNLIYYEDNNDHQAVAQCDDKYYFSRSLLKQHALNAGFSDFSEINVLNEGLLPEKERQIYYGDMLVDFFRGLGLSEKSLELIRGIADDLDATVGEQLLADYPINTLFLFWK